MGTLAFGADFTQVCRAGMGSLEDKDRQVLRKSVAKAKHRGIKEGKPVQKGRGAGGKEHWKKNLKAQVNTREGLGQKRRV